MGGLDPYRISEIRIILRFARASDSQWPPVRYCTRRGEQKASRCVCARVCVRVCV